jgi:2-furoyl-CoA dehydrogenase large subunit
MVHAYGAYVVLLREEFGRNARSAIDTTVRACEGQGILERRAIQIGRPVTRVEDARLLTGRGRYVDDLALPGCRAAAILRSRHAHARIVRIDTRVARGCPGVDAILTGADVVRLADPFPLAVGSAPAYYPAAVDRARFVGEPLAIVVAADRYRAEDALEAIEVEYEPLPVVLDPEVATRPGAPALHATHADNIGWRRSFRYGDPEGDFARADLVVAETLRYPRYHSVPLETYGVIAQYSEGCYTVHCNFQGPFSLHPVMARALRVTEDRLRILVPSDIGGSFGSKAMIYPYVVLLALAARAAGRPVRWIEDRGEHLHASAHGTDRVFRFEAALGRDGTILAVRGDLYDNVGAYLRAPEPANILRTISSYGGPYRVRSVAIEARAVMTNKAPAGLNRGYGNQQHCFGLERVVDLAAERLGLDPAEIRRRNLLRREEFPYRTVTGGLYDSGDYHGALDRLLETVRYEERRTEQRAARAAGRWLGIGLATTVDPATSNMGYITLALTPQERSRDGYLPKSGSVESARVKMDAAGAVSVVLATAGQGQSHETVAAQLVADELGLEPAQVRVVDAMDTSASAWTVSSGTYSSRFAAMGASAVGLAARRLAAKLLRIGAHLLEAPVEDLELADGCVRVKGSPFRSVRLRRLAGLAHWDPGTLPDGHEPGLEAVATYQFPGFAPPDAQDCMNVAGTYGFMADAAVVEVDPTTAEVTVLVYVSVHDAGRLLNPLVVEGQRTGALLHGLAAALCEEFVYDDEGQLRSGTFMDYLCPTACEMPPLQLEHLETASPFTLYGAKGCADGSVVPASAAIANAVADALRPFGVRVNELPVTPVRLWTWLRNAPGPSRPRAAMHGAGTRLDQPTPGPSRPRAPMQ